MKTKEEIAEAIHAQCDVLNALAAEAREMGLHVDFGNRQHPKRELVAGISEPAPPPVVYEKKEPVKGDKG